MPLPHSLFGVIRLTTSLFRRLSFDPAVLGPPLILLRAYIVDMFVYLCEMLGSNLLFCLVFLLASSVTYDAFHKLVRLLRLSQRLLCLVYDYSHAPIDALCFMLSVLGLFLVQLAFIFQIIVQSLLDVSCSIRSGFVSALDKLVTVTGGWSQLPIEVLHMATGLTTMLSQALYTPISWLVSSIFSFLPVVSGQDSGRVLADAYEAVDEDYPSTERPLGAQVVTSSKHQARPQPEFAQSIPTVNMIDDPYKVPSVSRESRARINAVLSEIDGLHVSRSQK